MKLARYFGISQSTIRTIKNNIPQSINDQCMEMLEDYNRNAGGSFIKLKLVKALNFTGLRKVIEKSKLCKFDM